MRHLILTLEAPLMAFGGETVDNYGVVRWFPAASMLTGLMANALGWRRTEADRHQGLQERLIFAARVDREPAGGVRMTDFQTAAISNKDRGWTTRGAAEGREGGNYTNWLRYRDYLADMRVTVVLRMEEGEFDPGLEDLAEALERPSRPLFIGRKPCLPSVRLFQGFQEGETVLAALLAVPLGRWDEQGESIRVLWPAGEGVESVRPSRRYMLTDERNWVSGLHGGGRSVCESAVPAALFPAAESGDTFAGEGGSA
ncbi:MAG: type I-E CRISPR-associated protein Cas5/CasD [Caldilineaceae bacterium]|nr:type I-E CRISPR-associated protein Cas5/CasD [Caldilineaceae bacterium]MDE0463782.1 type I-E CRISPR-associated protein Cas5/CasD [Caldilineaceae bacterium]